MTTTGPNDERNERTPRRDDDATDTPDVETVDEGVGDPKESDSDDNEDSDDVRRRDVDES